MIRTLCAAFLAAAFALAATTARAAESYETLVSRVKAGDLKIDYRALRMAYAASPHYQPEGGDYDDARNAMLQAFNKQDCATALAQADKVLASVFIDIGTHLASGRCYELQGDAAKAQFHRDVARGLMESILASGDGKSPSSAYVVVTIREEYDVLTTLRLKLKMQSLVQDSGHSYDKMDTTTASGANAAVFFQIDGPMTWLSNSLR